MIIFSAVRTRRKGGIGFVADERRINVGLTRARCSLLVVGNAEALKKDTVWASLMHHCREQQCAPWFSYLSSLKVHLHEMLRCQLAESPTMGHAFPARVPEALVHDMLWLCELAESPFA